MSRRVSWIIFTFTACFFALFFVLPVWHTIQVAFFTSTGEFTFDFVAEVFRNPLYRDGLINSAKMGILSTIGAMALAIPLALLGRKYTFPGKTILSSLLLVPMILPPFVGAIGVRQILGQAGSLNTILINLGLISPNLPIDFLGEGRLLGVVIMNALHLYPIAYLNLAAALANVDPAMEEAAENLGCSGFRRFRKITLPLIMPGIFAGGTIIFIWAFTELGVPLMFDYETVTSVQIFRGIKELSGNPFPYALVAVLLAITAIIYLASKFFLGSDQFGGSGRASRGRSEVKAPPVVGLLCTSVFALVIFLATLPHIGVILSSVAGDWYLNILPQTWTSQHYHDVLSDELTLHSIGNSLKYAGFSTLIDVILGVSIAYVIVRGKIPGRQLLDTMAMLPLAVPGLVLAFGYLAMSKEGGPFQGLLLAGSDPTLLLIIGYSIRRLPYVVRSAAAGLQQTNVTLEEAATNLGCPPLKAIRKITLPLISANLIAGALLAFSFAMLEVSDSLVLAEQAAHYPITKAIYTLTSALGNGDGLAAALGVWAMIFLGITLVGASVVLGKRLGALFRV